MSIDEAILNPQRTSGRPLRRHHLPACLWLCAAIVGLFTQTSAAAELPADQVDFFERKIRPVLVEHCYQCHNSGGKAEGGLKLDDRAGLLKGGDRGAAVIPGKAEESLLLGAIRHDHDDLRMPQGGPKLKPDVVADFARWIDRGAIDPRDKPPTADELAKATSWESIRERRKQWWSFQPLKSVALPPTDAPGSHPVDRLLAAGRRAAGLAPAPIADRRTLIRRLTFALVGLPPRPEEIEQFVGDSAPDAYERVVDRLLASPRFGERWARHWMDWFRYAETHGSEGDPAIPYAWRYRDYLIRALNADIPYDQLVREHVAGDLLPQPRIDAEQGVNESALGTGHYRMVQHGYVPTDALEEQVRFADNQIDTLSKAVLGLTLSCARCHHHKFDPLSQRDFYGWYGILASCRPAIITVDTAERRQRHRAELARLKHAIKSKIADAWEASSQHLADQLQKAPPPASRAEREQRAKNKQPVDAWQLAVDEAADSGGRSPLGAWVTMRGRSEKALVDEWQRQARQWSERAQQQAAFDAEKFPLRWDLRKDYQNWFKLGDGLGNKPDDGLDSGLGDGPSAAGEFHILSGGPQVVSNVYPAGVYTHRLSTKENGVLTSPSFPIDCDEICVRVSGGGGSRVRYVVQNYPRAILIYPSARPNQETNHWYRWDAKYWKGEQGHIEIATASDLPTDIAANDDRSWFGIVEVVGRNADGPVPPETGNPLFSVLEPTPAPPESPAVLADRYAAALGACIRAWRAGAMTDAQAEFLGYFVERRLLPNTMDELPAAAGSVAEYRSLERELPVPIRAPGVQEGTPMDQPLLIRGDHRKPGEVVPRRFLEVFDATPYRTRQSGRLELAASLTDPHNPLVPRVIVNRLWHHLFGVGIVPTTDNFGRLGDEPTQPELLDYLAARFSGQCPPDGAAPLKPWSLKGMVRLLVTSDAFRSSSHASPQAAELDSDNRQLSHFRVRRLEAEAIRDALLATAGHLDLAAWGPSVSGNGNRRSVYVRVQRNALDPLLGTFDAPEPHMTQGRRTSTNVPAQSLTLLNDPVVVDAAQRWAARIIGPGVNPVSFDDRAIQQRIVRMFTEALAREPTADELSRSIDYLRSSMGQDEDAQREVSRLTRETARCRSALEAIASPVRQRLFDQRGGEDSAAATPAAAALPAPIARWEFETDYSDSIGKLRGEPHGSARLENGGLVLDGRSHVVVSPLPLRLREKTLEIWVQCDGLDQRGGGVMSVETIGGGVFDAIVYAERDSRQWLSGSNFFARTQPFGGAAESEAQNRPIHLAIVYQEDGTIAAYRDGQPYGEPYSSKSIVTFEPERSQILFGLRHSPPGGNKFFKGSIFQAQLWDRALTREQVAACARRQVRYLSADALLAALPEPDKAEYGRLCDELTEIEHQLRQLAPRLAPSDPRRAWQDLAQSIFNLKEFIYVR